MEYKELVRVFTKMINQMQEGQLGLRGCLALDESDIQILKAFDLVVPIRVGGLIDSDQEVIALEPHADGTYKSRRPDEYENYQYLLNSTAVAMYKPRLDEVFDIELKNEFEPYPIPDDIRKIVIRKKIIEGIDYPSFR